MLNKDVVNELFKSEDMRKYVSENFDSLKKEDIAWLVYYAPISIFRKKELLDMLGNPIDFERTEWLWPIDLLVALLQLREEEYVIVYKHDARNGERLDSVKISKYEDIIQYLKSQEQDENIYTIKLYCYNGRGEFGCFPRLFYVVKGEICCAACYQGGGIYYEGSAYNIYSPFKKGDVIELDCRPFVQVRHFLLLQSGDEKRGLPPALYVTEDGRIKMEQWNESSTIFQYCPIPPLYDAKVCETLSTAEETIFPTIIQWLKKDDKNAKKLKDYMDKNATVFGVTPESMKVFISNTDSASNKELQQIKSNIVRQEKRLDKLLFSIIENEDDYDNAEDIMSDFLGGSLEVEWYEQRDIRYLEEMITSYKKLAQTLEMIEQKDEKNSLNKEKALEVMVSEARRIKKDKEADIEKAKEAIKAMDKIIKVCDIYRDWYL